MLEKDLAFRKVNRDDLTAIVRLLADDPLGSQREDFREPLPEKYIQAFEAISADANQELMLAEMGGAIVATFQLSFLPYLTYQGGVRAQVEAVRVNKAYRGEGIGKRVFEYAIERSKTRGAHLLQLTTDKKRPEARKFYESLGFIASHEGVKLHF